VGRLDRNNQRDRRRKDRFVALSYDMIGSEAFRHAPAAAVKLLVLIRERYTGFNNGKIAVARTEAALLLHLGKDTVDAGFAELQARGFIQLVRKGRPGGRAKRLASEWALTDRPLDIEPPDGFVHAVGAWRYWRKINGPEVGPLTPFNGPERGPLNPFNGPEAGPESAQNAPVNGPEVGPHISTMGIAAGRAAQTPPDSKQEAAEQQPAVGAARLQREIRSSTKRKRKRP
jgi:hypothetical protein